MTTTARYTLSVWSRQLNDRYLFQTTTTMAKDRGSRFYVGTSVV